MASLYAPSEKGFDVRLEAVDHCQIGLLRELSSSVGARLALKGGMAMRAAFGSMRLTKDIDFDRDQTISQESLKKSLERSLLRAAHVARLSSPKVRVTKDTGTTLRVRLEGALSGKTDVRFDVEVSGRAAPAAAHLRSVIVAPPARYAMAPFPVATYTDQALAAMKISAALSAQRNAPRDLYDLRDLIWAHADPTDLLAEQDADLLEDLSERALGKLELITFQLAQQELLPYLPADVRQAINQDGWIEMTLMVADTIQCWCKDAMKLQQARHRSQGPI
jgi:hypothetical protein